VGFYFNNILYQHCGVWHLFDLTLLRITQLILNFNTFYIVLYAIRSDHLISDILALGFIKKKT